MKKEITKYEWILIKKALIILKETYSFIRGFGKIGVVEKIINNLIEKVKQNEK